MKKILVLRSGGTELSGGEGEGADVVLLVTHEIVPNEAGIAGALAFDSRGARLIVSSRVTVEVLSAQERPLGSGTSDSGEAGAGAKRTGFFEGEFSEVLAVGEETARAVREAREAQGARSAQGAGGSAAPSVEVPPMPGAAGVLHVLREKKGPGRRILWPRGSDADRGAIDELRTLGFDVEAPVVYEKKPRPLASLPQEERRIVSAFEGGEFGAVGVGSMAALEVLLAWLGSPAPAALPQVRWGVLGPETARAFVARGLPAPAVSGRSRFVDLIARLRNDIGRNET